MPLGLVRNRYPLRMKPPWSTNQLKRLGDALRDEATLPTSLPDYATVVAWYDDLAASIHRQIAALGLEAAGGAPVQISSRAKTIETLRDKLRREWPIRLPSIQDLAGVRVVADMNLVEQDQMVAKVIEVFGHDQTAIHDLRNEPHSGYRAVHVWLRLEGGRAEVQVRTALQSSWANAYEALADLAGRDIRYGGDPKWVEGVPDVIRNPELANQEAFSDFVQAVRWMSEHPVTATEKTRTLLELWADGATAGRDTMPVILDHLQSDWRMMPGLKDRQMPEIDPGADGAVFSMREMLGEIEAGTATMMDSLRDALERIRREAEKGSS